MEDFSKFPVSGINTFGEKEIIELYSKYKDTYMSLCFLTRDEMENKCSELRRFGIRCDSSAIRAFIQRFEPFYIRCLLYKDYEIVLSKCQAEAVSCENNNELIVSGAGGGKTTVLLAKVKYLVERKKVDQQKIFVTTFNRKNIYELQDRIAVVGLSQVEAKTMHAKGNMLLKTNSNFEVFDGQNDMLYVYQFLTDIAFKKDPELRQKLESNNMCLDVSNMSLAKKKNKLKRMLVIDKNGTRVRSRMEWDIAMWLLMNRICFKYEDFPEHSKYKNLTFGDGEKVIPDFSIYSETSEGKIEREVLYEHYSYHNDGKTCVGMKGAELSHYKKRHERKNKLYEEKHCEVIRTYSGYEFGPYNKKKNGFLLDLEEQVRKKGFVVRPMDKKEEELFYDEFDGFLKYVELCRNLLTFLDRFREKYDTIEGLDISSCASERERLFLLLFKVFYDWYGRFKENAGFRDFTDMLIDSTRKMDQIVCPDSYRYIIIDEFQDISKRRFDFIKALAKCCGSKIIGIGDDWQCINEFSGSDLRLFKGFEELCQKRNSLFQIPEIRRYGQTLCDISSSFISRRESSRYYSSSIEDNKSPVRVFKYTGNVEEACFELLKMIAEENGKNCQVEFLKRHRFDFNSADSNYFSDWGDSLTCRELPGLKLGEMNIHKAKGLEWDFVVVVNNNKGDYGFPHKKGDDEIFRILNYSDSDLSEERRLFYVALTRARKKVYLMSEKGNESCFIEELLEANPNIVVTTLPEKQG